MAKSWAQSRYIPKHPEKYMGSKSPFARSSWETQFMMFVDNNPNVLKWASESIKIPYKVPFTNRSTVYVPDFYIQYVDAKGQINNEIIEIKPANQTLIEKAGRNKFNQAQYIKNQVKWAAANAYCRQQGLKFRIITENDLFAQT